MILVYYNNWYFAVLVFGWESPFKKEVKVNFLTETSQQTEEEPHLATHSQSWCMKGKTVNKLSDFTTAGTKLWNYNKITFTSTPPSIVQTAIR